MGRLAKTALKLLFYILLFLVTFLPVFSQTRVKSVSFIQIDELFSEKYLSGKLTLKSNSIFSDNKFITDIENIRQTFLNNCYPFVEIKADLNYSNDSNLVDIIYNINHGKTFSIGNIVIVGNTFFSKEEILNNFETQSNKCLNQIRLESDIESLIKKYENNGFPFAAVSVAEISIQDVGDSAYLKVTIEIDEGARVRIDQIKVEGNTDTKANIIIRETHIQYGEIYNQIKINKISRRLNRLNIFNSVNEPEIFVIANPVITNTKPGVMKVDSNNYQSGGILITLTEGNTNRFDGIIGYLPGSGNEAGYFTGLVDVGMRNLFGTARKLFVKWSRDDRYSQEIGIRYVEPWIFSYPINLGGYFFQRQQDTTYIKRAIELKSDFQLSDNLTIGIFLNQEQIIPSSEILNQFVKASGMYSGGIEVQYDIRDDIYNPTEGISYRADYRYGRKKIYSVNQLRTIQKLGLDIEWAIPVISSPAIGKQVAVVSLHGRDIKGIDIDVSDLYRFGGANTLRGYRENQFLGSRVLWSNTEYRFLTGKRSFVFGFFDLGYYFRLGNLLVESEIITTSIESVKYGYGIGIRFETALGIIGVSFALGKGDNFNQAKIHFGLVSEF